mmetsp:Transcript_28474/g.91776  ORF Transcript_28474/g.91776 Transcript_28474/m.91776 type:complete len:299 (+) Transcript_28474:488-1384(+)
MERPAREKRRLAERDRRPAPARREDHGLGGLSLGVEAVSAKSRGRLVAESQRRLRSLPTGLRRRVSRVETSLSVPVLSEGDRKLRVPGPTQSHRSADGRQRPPPSGGRRRPRPTGSLHEAVDCRSRQKRRSLVRDGPRVSRGGLHRRHKKIRPPHGRVRRRRHEARRRPKSAGIPRPWDDSRLRPRRRRPQRLRRRLPKRLQHEPHDSHQSPTTTKKKRTLPHRHRPRPHQGRHPRQSLRPGPPQAESSPRRPRPHPQRLRRHPFLKTRSLLFFSFSSLCCCFLFPIASKEAVCGLPG